MDDIIAPGLRALIVAINPATRSAEIGHAFSSPGNPFWRLLHASRLTPVLLAPDQEQRLLEFGLGLTSTVRRATSSAGELSVAERRAGVTDVRRLVAQYQPEVVALLGLTLYPLYAPGRSSRGPGLAHDRLEGSDLFVLPNPSGRNRAYAGFDRKLVWYRDLADHLADRRADHRPRRHSGPAAVSPTAANDL
jgi:double-stranded uracil-DNA glycosylase